MAEQEHRLPSGVVPEHYRVHIHCRGEPVEANTPFDGLVEVELLAEAAAGRVTLHSLDLEWAAADVELREAGDGGAAVGVRSVAFREAVEQADIELEAPLRAGARYVLRLRYTGVINDKLAGFYRSTYTAPDGVTQRALAVTQFEATDARRALPCWDEPALKATFQLVMYAPAALRSISNTRVAETLTVTGSVLAADRVARRLGVAADGSMARHTFGRTPRMSSYLLAFCVGEFDYLAGHTRAGVEVRVYTPLGKAALGKFALDTAVVGLDFLADFFGRPYQLRKADLLAIPSFAAGAMENWGMVTYRETRLLIDPERSSAEARRRTARTVMHELSHSYFGNEVTMTWWTYLFLNESFARFTEHLAVDHAYPEWNIWLPYLKDVHALALRLDALESSHAIEVEVRHPSEINEIFDAISYAKGSSLIRMLQAYAGPEQFRKAIQSYIARFSYGNATSTDLWNEIGAACDKPVLEMMDAWTHRVGFPVLTVAEVEEAGGGGARRLRVRQERFLASGPAPDDDTVWVVPVEVAWQDPATGAAGGSHRYLLDTREAVLDVPAPAGATLRVNPGHTGYYRVHYSQGMMDALAARVAAGHLGPEDRLGLADDAAAVTASGRAPVRYLLGLLRHYAGERSYPVAATVATALRGLAGVHAGEPHHDALKAYVRRVFAPLMELVGWDASEGDADEAPRLRALALGMMGVAGDESIGAEAARRVAADPSAIHADTRGTAYKLAARFGGEAAWTQLMALLEAADLPEEKLRLMDAVGRCRDEALQARTLEWALSDRVRLSDLPYALGSLCSTPGGRALVWRHVTENFDAFVARFDGVGFLAGSVFASIVGNAKTAADADEMEAFFKEHQCPAAARKISQSLERVRTRAARLAREGAPLAEFLAAE